MDPNKADKLAGTVVIADFAERRAREPAREEPTDQEVFGPGTKIGRYLIVDRLGGGGMGVVYKAQDTELHRTVALKILPPHLCRNPEYLNRFRSEAQAQARLNSPYVIMLYSLLELPLGEILVLEYGEGQTLEQRLRSGGPLSPDEAVRIFEQALRGVEHIHRAGVVHRDLKPGNIFLTRDGRVKLMDFGVAKIMDQPDHGPQRTMVGTLLYISPEQINGYTTDFRSDIYTLGVSLFESVTGRLPFERRTDYALMHAHVQERPPRPKELQRSIPSALETAILRAVEKDPDRRFQTASDFRRSLMKLGLIERRTRALVEGLRPGPIKPRERSSESPPRRLLGGLWLDAALIATVCGLIYILGIYPAKSPVANDVASPVVNTNTTTLNTSKKPQAATAPAKRAPISTPPTPPAKPAPEDPKKKYDALREAWGN